MSRLQDPDRINKSLAQQLKISDSDIRERKDLLGFTFEDEGELAQFRETIVSIVEDIVGEFYERQLEIPRVRTLIGDSETLDRLQNAMKLYVLRLFGGEYGADYVNSRLRIGKIHARIGVPPKFYVSSLHQLEELVGKHLVSASGLEAPPKALRKLFLLDLQLAFDTYIQGLVSEVETARMELQDYSDMLERRIEERTAQIISWKSKASSKP